MAAVSNPFRRGSRGWEVCSSIKTMPLDGKTAHHVGDVCVMCVLLAKSLPEFFVTTGTHIDVKLLRVFWATQACTSIPLSLCLGWGWQPPQTASRIHIRHIKSIWLHWCAVHRHTVLTQVYRPLLGSDLTVLGHFYSQNDVITSWSRLTATSICFLHPYNTYTKCLITLICCPLAYGSSLT